MDGGPLTVAIASLKFVLCFIQYGEREEGVVYPGEEKVMMLELSPGGAICPDQSITDTSCTTVITSDCNNYSISLTLSNDVGASLPATADFDRECFL